MLDGTRYAPQGMVCSVDHLASAAGLALLRADGSAADAAVAAGAVLAVTSQHLCGMGGDLVAVVSPAGRPAGRRRPWSRWVPPVPGPTPWRCGPPALGGCRFAAWTR